MRQTIYRVDHAPTLGQPCYTTAWRVGDRIFHTYNFAGVTGDLVSFGLHSYERGYDLATLVSSTFEGTLTRIA